MKVKTHAEAAEKFIQDEPRTDWHDETLWFVREKRDRSMHGVNEWELLREWASKIKDHTLSNLDNLFLILNSHLDHYINFLIHQYPLLFPFL